MHPLRRLDNFLNGITMYRLMVYILSLLLALAFVFMLTGVLSYSAIGLVITTGVLTVACFVANMGLAKLFKITPNHESGIITTLILACILPQTTTVHRALLIALTGVLAMAVKYILVWRGSHFLNPAAAAAMIVSLLGLLPVTWWIGNPMMVIPTFILGMLILRKTRRFTLYIVFVLTAAAMMLLVSSIHGVAAGSALYTLIFSYPLVFLGTIMLTEPTTMPAGRFYQGLYAAIVGVLFSAQLDLGFVSTSPHIALIIGNIFSLLVSPKQGIRAVLKGRTGIGNNLYDFAFSMPTGRHLPYRPGQYLEWTLPGVKLDARGNRRTFTISSSPTEKELHVTIKTYEPSSAFKRRFLELKPGDVVLAGHIGGNFTMPADTTQKLLFVAGGIGITPFRSMLKYLVDIDQKRDIYLIYAARPDEFAFKADFDAATAQGVKTIRINDMLDAAKLAELVPDYAARATYISGPPPMVRGLKAALLAAGIKPTSIHTDLFTGY